MHDLSRRMPQRDRIPQALADMKAQHLALDEVERRLVEMRPIGHVGLSHARAAICSLLQDERCRCEPESGWHVNTCPVHGDSAHREEMEACA